MNTPDTEWWKKVVDEDFCSFSPLTRDAINELIDKVVTSRDTYWKERVEDVGRKIAQDIATYKSYWNPIGDERNTGRHYACDDILPQVQSLLKEITNEDNLK